MSVWNLESWGKGFVVGAWSLVKWLHVSKGITYDPPICFILDLFTQTPILMSLCSSIVYIDRQGLEFNLVCCQPLTQYIVS